MPVTAAETHRVIETVWRMESAKLIAGLARIVRDVGLAEDLAQDALLAALERWPESGIPDNPGAWLMATAKHRSVDQVRRRAMLERKHEQLGYELEAQQEAAVPDLDAAIDDHVGDDMLRLMFTACHPVLSTDARVALTLRLLGGLTTDEIARAFLVPEATMAQRLVRARRKIAHAAIPYRVPPDDLLGERLEGVLAVLYLVFNTGYSGGASTDLAATAIALSEAVVDLMPRESEARGLLALMLLQNSRRCARFSSSGELLTLEEQDRSMWNAHDIDRGRAMLGTAIGRGSYVVQASLAECHAVASTSSHTDWNRIVALYDELLALSPSPVAWFNRAIAVGMRDGPEAGLKLLDELPGELTGFRLVPAARADLLRRAGLIPEAIAQYREAIPVAATDAERAQLWRKLSELND